MTEEEFLKATTKIPRLTEVQRGVGLIWFYTARLDSPQGLTSNEIAASFVAAGFPAPNGSRLRAGLERDRRLHQRQWRFKINPKSFEEIEQTFEPLCAPGQRKPTADFVDTAEVAGTRKYLEHVVWQINLSYEQLMFDCASVMLRRLIETLIIECFEAKGVAQEIKGGDGEYMMLSGLVASCEKTAAFTLGRDAKRTLKEVKALGDRSAHNRRYTAKKHDLEPLRSGCRVLVEELVHVAGLK